MKVTGLLLAATQVPRFLIGKEAIEKTGVKSLETEKAFFFPLYERHDKPLSSKEIEKLPGVDVFLYEYQIRSGYLASMDSTEVLNQEVQFDVSDKSRRPLIPEGHVEALLGHKASISFEGFLYSDDIKGELAKHRTIDIAEQAEKLVDELNTDPNLEKVQIARQLASKVERLVNNPDSKENFIFFRNVMIARRLQFLAEAFSELRKRKAQIGFSVGRSHEGIEDLLTLGDQSVLTIIESYPPEFLEKLVNINGGIDAFCSTTVLTPLKDNPMKIELLDRDLKELLESKLSQRIVNK